MTTNRPVKTLTHFHTFHPDAQAEFDRLMAEEKRLTRELARRSEDPEQAPIVRMDGSRRRMSEAAPQDIDAALAEVRAKMDEQRATIATGAVRITLSGLPRGAYRALISAHPPRDGDDLDQRLGYNSDTFGDALIEASILGCHDLNGQPVPNQWGEWADEMTNGQWEEVFTEAFQLQRRGNPVFPR